MIGNKYKLEFKVATKYRCALFIAMTPLVLILGIILSSVAHSSESGSWKRDVELIDLGVSHPKFHRVSRYFSECCQDDGSDFPPLRQGIEQYVQQLDSLGNPLGPKIGFGLGNFGDFPTLINVLDSPVGFPYVAISIFNYGASDVFTEMILLDPRQDYKIVTIINQPLSKMLSTILAPWWSWRQLLKLGSESELEGVYVENGKYYVNTLDEISYAEQTYAVTKRQIIDRSPYVREASRFIRYK